MMRKTINWFALVAGATLFAAFAIGLNQTLVMDDLTQRSQAALKSLGHDWAQVSLSGRDARLSGAAPNAETIKEAVSAVERVPGIRLVESNAAIAPPKPPRATVPLFELLREGRSVAISGTVADETARKVIRESILAALPDVRLTDRMTIASGLPGSFATFAAFAAAEAVKLDPVSAQIKGNTLIVQGKSASFAVFDTIASRLRQPPSGLVVARQDILPPTVRPFTFAIQYDGKNAVLDGFIASEQVRRDLLQALSQHLPGVTIVDQLRIAEGSPRDAMSSYTFALIQLGRMRSGFARFSDNALTFEGEPLDRATYVAAVNAFSASLPAHLQLASAVVRLPTVSPYRWTAEKSGMDLLVQGYVPHETARDIITGAARRAAAGLPLRDEQALAQGAPSGFEAAIMLALRQLELMKNGRISLIGNQLELSGEVADADTASAIRAAIAGAKIDGVSIRLDLREPPPPVVATPQPPNPPSPVEPQRPVLSPEASQCQERLSRIVDHRIILFETGKDTISPDSLPILDEIVVVLRDCRIAALTIEGHTDTVGAPDANLILSKARAASVKAYLLDKGIAEALLQVVGFGDSRPIADNGTEEGRARNRRIAFTVTQ